MNLKKALACILSCTTIGATALSSPFSFAAAETLSVTLAGDANCDGVVTMDDVNLIYNKISDPMSYSITEQGWVNADVYEPGYGIDAQDAWYIQYSILGITLTGDADCDGVVTMADVELINNYLMSPGSVSLPDGGWNNAAAAYEPYDALSFADAVHIQYEMVGPSLLGDVDCDGVVTMADVEQFLIRPY